MKRHFTTEAWRTTEKDGEKNGAVCFRLNHDSWDEMITMMHTDIDCSIMIIQ